MLMWIVRADGDIYTAGMSWVSQLKGQMLAIDMTLNKKLYGPKDELHKWWDSL